MIFRRLFSQPCETSHYASGLCGVLQLTLRHVAKQVLYIEEEQVQHSSKALEGKQTQTTCLILPSSVPMSQWISAVPSFCTHLHTSHTEQPNSDPEPQTVITTTTFNQQDNGLLVG